MTQRGRKPASLSLLPSVDGRPERLRPPPHLTETEHQAFLDLVTSCDKRHFVASDMPLLAAYARAIVADKTAAREICEQGAAVNGKPNAWLVPKEKAHREVVVLSLRLSPQGRAQHAPVSGPTSYYDRMRSARQHDEAD